MFGRRLRRENRQLLKEADLLKTAVRHAEKRAGLAEGELATWQRRAERHCDDAIAAARSEMQMRIEAAGKDARVRDLEARIAELTATAEKPQLRPAA